MHDYLPSNDEELLIFADNLNTYAAANYSRWQIPGPQTFLDAPVAAYRTALAAFSDPNHGKIDTLNKKETKEALLSVLRIYIQGFIARNPAVTDEDRERMGLPLRDKTPTPTPKPEGVPEVEVSTPLPRTVRFRFRAANAKHWGKPAYVHGIEILWVIADTPPVHIKELVHSEFATRNPLDLTFDEDQRGKRIYFAAR
jgi:hypothetical protein